MSDTALFDFCARAAAAAEPMRRYWTPADTQFLADNLPVLPVAEISSRLGRSENAIKIHQVRYGIPVASKQPGYLTGNQVAVLLCIDIHAVMMLHRRGLIPLRVLPGERHIMAMSLRSLYVWAINPVNWIYFKPARVRDPHLRRLIELRRQRWNDEWWSTQQVADYYGLANSNSVQAAIMRGQLRATRWANWWVLRSNALNHPMYPGRGGNMRNYQWPPRADAWILRAHDELGLSFAAVGRTMKWTHQRVAHRYKMLRGGK